MENRLFNIGFFNIEVLLKYIHHPLYGLDIGADTFGYIYKGVTGYLQR